MSGIQDIQNKLEMLRLRIKNTSSVRFYAARRVRTNYHIAQLTVVILSLWAILISYLLATELAKNLNMCIQILTAVGVILPVFIVVFSLLENGESFVRSHQLEFNARQLRELSDQLYTSSAVKGLEDNELLQVYDIYSQKYSDSLERSPVNHDEIDHLHRIYSKDLAAKSTDLMGKIFIILKLANLAIRTHYRRFLYIVFWFAPLIFLMIPSNFVK